MACKEGEGKIQSRESLDHFGLAVHDMDAAVRELKGKGLKFVVEPTQVPFLTS